IIHKINIIPRLPDPPQGLVIFITPVDEEFFVGNIPDAGLYYQEIILVIFHYQYPRWVVSPHTAPSILLPGFELSVENSKFRNIHGIIHPTATAISFCTVFSGSDTINVDPSPGLPRAEI